MGAKSDDHSYEERRAAETTDIRGKEKKRRYSNIVQMFGRERRFMLKSS